MVDAPAGLGGLCARIGADDATFDDSGDSESSFRELKAGDTGRGHWSSSVVTISSSTVGMPGRASVRFGEHDGVDVYDERSDGAGSLCSSASECGE